MRLGSGDTGRRRLVIPTLAVLALAGIGLVCVVLPLLSGSRRADIPPYGGARWEDGGTTYYTNASQRDVLNYYKVQFGERGFATMLLCPGQGERVEDYLAPHPRIRYADRGAGGPEFTSSGGVKYTYVNRIDDPSGGCPPGRTDASGDVNAQLDVAELSPLSDVWLDYSVEYRAGQGPGGTNLVMVQVNKSDQGGWGR